MKLIYGCVTRPYAALGFAEACQHIAAAGFWTISLSGNAGKVAVRADSTEAEVRAAREAALSAGVIPSAVLGRLNLALGLEGAVADYRRLIDNVAELGARWLIDLSAGDPAQFDAYVEAMRELAPYAQYRGLGISMKPHGGICLTISDLLHIHVRVNHPAFGICYDPGNLLYYSRGAERPEDSARIAQRVTTAIIKDCVVRDGVPDVMITPGEGMVKIPAVLGGLIRGGFAGPLYLECVGGKEIAEIDSNVRRAKSYVEGILSNILRKGD